MQTVMMTSYGMVFKCILALGKGFSSSNCGNTVTIGAGHLGQYSCNVVSSSSTQIECDIMPNEDTMTFTSYYVRKILLCRMCI